MTPRHRWRRTNRPQTPRNSLLRRDFCGNRPEHKVKKIARRFERSARVLRPIYVGAVIPPHRLYSARAPIHPKRPYGLTRPVVPPDGSFLFSTAFRSKALFARGLIPWIDPGRVPLRAVTPRQTGQGSDSSSIKIRRPRADLFRAPPKEIPAASAQRRHAALRLDCG